MKLKNKDILASVKIKFAISTKEIEHLVNTVQQISLLCGINKKIIYNKIPLIIDESLRNCIIHGNKSDCNKKILFNALFTNFSLCMSFEDEGGGFDHHKTVEELKKNKKIGLDIDKGRGILLISKLVDKLEYYSNGKGLKIELKIKPR